MGTLLLVATPIGHLGDISARAVRALREAALVCCEDTRRTGKLMSHLGIAGVPMAIANEHTEMARVAQMLELLGAGAVVAVVTDAGTPAISDPGEVLVRAAIEHGHTVSAVPGPSAEVMALIVSGLATKRYVFDGFLPRSGPERAKGLRDACSEHRTVLLYEAPHRLARTLGDLIAGCGGDRRVVLARELTKVHEQVWRGTLDEAAAHVAGTCPIGEYVIVLAGAPAAATATDDEIGHELTLRIESGASTKSAVADVAARLEAPKNRVYDIALALGRGAAGPAAR